MKWRQWILWAAVSLAVIVLFGAIGGYLFLRSRAFRHYAMAKIVQKADAATGGRLALQNFDFHLFSLTAHLYGITVHGKEGSDQKPLLTIDKVTVTANLSSLLHRELVLSQLRIEHPVAHLVIDKRGNSNLPEPPEKKATSAGPNIFDLEVGHALLTRGEIYCNDVKGRVNADVRNLRSEAHYSFLASGYEGSLSYSNGILQYAHFPPYSHSLNLQFTASPSSFSAKPLVLSVGSSRATLQAKIANYQQPTINGEYEIRLHAQDFTAFSTAAKPAGDVMLTGTVQYRSTPDAPFIQGIHLDGQLHSDWLKAVASSGELQIKSLQARYTMAHGRLEAHDIAANLLDGRLAADLVMDHLDANPHTLIQASLQNVAIEALRGSLRQPRLRQLPFSGNVDAGLNAAWTGSPRNVRLSSHLEIHATAWNRAAGSAQSIPVTGTIHFEYDGPRRLITVHQTSLEAAATTLSAQGEISNHSNLQIQVNARDLSRTARLASLSGSSSPESAALEGGVSGSATLKAVMHGSMQRPDFSGEVQAQNLQTHGSRWKDANLTFKADPSQVTVRNAVLVNAHQGEVKFHARAALHRWSFTPSSQIEAQLAVHQMAIADLQHFAGLHYPVAGAITVNLSVMGSQLSPAGKGTVQITKAHLYGEPVQNVTLNFQADSGTINSNLKANLPAGTLSADLRYTPRTKAYGFRFEAPAIELSKLQTVQERNIGLEGTVNASGSGQGTLANPALTAVLRLPQLKFRDKQITAINAQLNVANQKANITLTSQVAQAQVEAHGTVSLQGAYDAEFNLDTPRMPLDPLLATYVSNLPEGFQGETELHATLKGPLKERSRIEAHITIPVFRAAYQRLQIESAGPIRADYLHSVLTLHPVELKGTGTSLRVQGTVPLAGSASMNLTANGSLDVRVLQIVRPDVKSSGRVALDIHATGGVHSAAMEGHIKLQNVALSAPAAPLGVEKLNGDLELNNDKLQISNLTGQAGGGEVSAGGSITFRPQLQFNLGLQGKSVRLRYPDGVRTVLDSDLAFNGTRASSALTGRVLIDSLSFTPDFDLGQFVNQFSGVSVPPPPESFTNSVKVQISVQSTQSLRATSQQLSLAGTADLRVIGTVANPVIVGRADLTSGELFFRNHRYNLERGLVSFNNPVQTSPTVDMVATTAIEQYNLTITLRGPFDRLNTSYVSDPPLATADIINLVAQGQTTEQAGASTMSPDSLLAGQVAGQVTGGIQKLAGLSSLQIDPLIGGNNQNPSARVALQQRVTRNLLFTFSTDVSEPGSEVVQGDYRINRRWSVSVARNQQGGVSIDGRYHTKF